MAMAHFGHRLTCWQTAIDEKVSARICVCKGVLTWHIVPSDNSGVSQIPVLPWVRFRRTCVNQSCCCRDVTAERKAYPSFAPEDFPAVYKASQKALKTATKAIGSDPDSQVLILTSAHHHRMRGRQQQTCRLICASGMTH